MRWPPICRKIRPPPTAKILGLADVDDASRRIFHQIDAGVAREALDLLTYVHRTSPALLVLPLLPLPPGEALTGGAGPSSAAPGCAPAGQRCDRAAQRRARSRNGQPPLSCPCAVWQ